MEHGVKLSLAIHVRKGHDRCLQSWTWIYTQRQKQKSSKISQEAGLLPRVVWKSLPLNGKRNSARFNPGQAPTRPRPGANYHLTYFFLHGISNFNKASFVGAGRGKQ